MSFYYDTIQSKYHIDLNNPKVAYDDDWAMTMYGEFRAHASDSHRRLNSQGIGLKEKGTTCIRYILGTHSSLTSKECRASLCTRNTFGTHASDSHGRRNTVERDSMYQEHIRNT